MTNFSIKTFLTGQLARTNYRHLLVFGALLVGLCHGIKLTNWQVALEGAQVLAGLVDYPALNPQGMYHTRLWTLLNQIPALLLYLGMSERILSILISGIGGSLFYLGITLATYAVSKNILVSLVMPMLVLVTGSAGAAGGITYPVILLNSPHTYGSFGLSIAVIIVGLVGCGRYNAAMLVTGVLPCVHPSWGVWINFVMILTFVIYFRKLMPIVRKSLRWLLVGYVLTSLSLCVWYFQSYFAVDHIVNLTNYSDLPVSSNWDSHRRAIQGSDLDFRNGWNFHTVFLLAMACGASLILFRSNKSLRGKYLFVVLLVSSLGAVLASAIVSTTVGSISETLRALMPQRWLNLSILLFLPIVIGSLSWRKTIDIGWSVLLIVVAVILFKFGRQYSLLVLWVASAFFVYLGLLNRLQSFDNQSPPRIGVLCFIALLVPAATASPMFLVMHFSSTSYFYVGVLVHVTVCIGSVSLLRVTRDFGASSKLLLYGSLCLMLFAINLFVTPILLPDWRDESVMITSGWGVILLTLSLSTIVMCRPILKVGDQVMSKSMLAIANTTRRYSLFDRTLMSINYRSGYVGLVVVLLCSGFWLGKITANPAWEHESFNDRTTSEFWKETENGEGFLLTGSDLYLIQLRSRRPVLIDGGALNWLPYIPSARANVEKLLLEIYGIVDYESRVARQGKLAPEAGKQLWIARSYSDWKLIKEKFGVNNVVVYDDWVLDLPVVSKNNEYVLYHIP